MKNLQFRRGLKEDLPVLLEGEPGYSTDTKELHIGNSDGENSTFLNQSDTESYIEEKVSIVNTNLSEVQDEIEVISQEIIDIKSGIQDTILDVGVNSDNIATLADDLQDKIMIGSAPHNLDFIEREVVQEGLIESNFLREPTHEVINNPLNSTYSIVINTTIDEIPKNTSRLIEINNAASTLINIYLRIRDTGSISGVRFLPNDKSTSEVNIGAKKGTKLQIVLNFNKNGESSIFANGTHTLSYIARQELFENTWKFDRNELATKDTFYQVYNRILSPEEIAHNFQVLSQNPSLDKLITTDADNNKKEFCFATDSSHVVMANGYNAEECASGLLATMAQEFVADAGTGEIAIENVIEKSKLLGVEMQGQTVKNICMATPEAISKLVPNLNDGSSLSFFNVTLFNSLLPNATYTIIFTNKPEFITEFYISGINMQWTSKSFTFTTGDTVQDRSNFQFRTTRVATEEDIANLQFVIIEGEHSGNIINSYIPFGLNSVEATLSIDNNKYSFYEPVIEGRTEVIDGELVSLEPSGEGLPTLGSVGDICDTIDRETKVITLNTEEYTFTGEENFYISSNQSINGCTLFEVARIIVGDYNVYSYVNTISDYFEIVSSNTLSKAGTARIYVNGSKQTFTLFSVKNEVATTVEEFKTFMSGRKIRYQLAEPIVHQLTTEEFNAYDIHKKVICLNRVEKKHPINDREITYDNLFLDKYGNITVNKNTIELSITGNEEWVREQLSENGTHKAFSCRNTSNPYVNVNSNAIVDNYLFKIWLDGWLPKLDDTYVGFTSANEICISLPIEIANNIEELKNYLKSTGGFKIIYQLEIPITTHIDHKAATTIPLSSQQINIHSASTVAPSNLKVVAPINQIASLKTRLAELENSLTNLSELSTNL